MKAKPKVYFAEFNRCRGDSIRGCTRRLKLKGLDVDIVPHKTTLRIERPVDMRWGKFLDALRNEVQPKIGSVVLFAPAAEKAFLCSKRGNQPGLFLKI